MPNANRKSGNYTAEELTDVESPELTDDELASLRPASEALTPTLHAALTRRKPGQRGLQKGPTKELVSLRIDRDVLAAFRETGAGWQGRVNDTLRSAVMRSSRGGKPKVAAPVQNK